jgi:DNA mismatch repair ATPase MutS
MRKLNSTGVVSRPRRALGAVAVAGLAGLPRPVIDKARQLLSNLEAAEIAAGGGLRATGKRVVDNLENNASGRPSGYLPLLEPATGESSEITQAEAQKYRKILDLLLKTDPNRTTPIRALQLLDRLRKIAIKV